MNAWFSAGVEYQLVPEETWWGRWGIFFDERFVSVDFDKGFFWVFSFGLIFVEFGMWDCKLGSKTGWTMMVDLSSSFFF